MRTALSWVGPALSWIGILLFTVIAVLATVHLGRDIISVATHTTSMAALREVGVAAAVILGAAAWLLVIVRLAGSGGRGITIAIAAGVITLVAVRVAIAFAYDGEMSGEPGVYHNLARGVLEGRCCGAEPVDRPMGFPVMLAVAYAIAGQSAFAAESLNLLLALLTGLAVLALARGAYGPRVGAVALMLYALWPAGALVITTRLPQTAYDLAILAAAWAAVAAPQGWRGSALAGALLGLSQYVRPTSMALLPAFLLVRVWPGGPWRRLMTGAVVPMVVTFLVVLVPIMAWNLSTRGVPDISTSAHGGKSFYHGTDVRSGGRWSRLASEELGELAGSDTWERSRVGLQLAIERIREDPIGIALLAVRKQYTLWGSESYGVRYGIRRELAGRPYLPKSVLPSLASGVFYAAITAATAFGLYLGRRRTDSIAVLVVTTAISISLLHSLVEVRDRYHSYVIPLLMPIAALAIVAITRRLRWVGGKEATDDEPSEPSDPDEPAVPVDGEDAGLSLQVRPA